jgi:hypothetical protein
VSLHFVGCQSSDLLHCHFSQQEVQHTNWCLEMDAKCLSLQKYIFMASRVVQWSNALHRSVLRCHYSLWFESQAVSLPAVTGSPIGPGGLYLAHRALATSCGGLGACRLTSSVERCFLRNIGAAHWLSEWVLRSAVGGSCLEGRVTLPSPLGSFSDETRS